MPLVLLAVSKGADILGHLKNKNLFEILFFINFPLSFSFFFFLFPLSFSFFLFLSFFFFLSFSAFFFFLSRSSLQPLPFLPHYTMFRHWLQRRWASQLLTGRPPSTLSTASIAALRVTDAALRVSTLSIISYWAALNSVFLFLYFLLISLITHSFPPPLLFLIHFTDCPKSNSVWQRLKELSEMSNGKLALLRVKVDSGGCHGYQYGFELVQQVEEDDMLVIGRIESFTSHLYQLLYPICIYSPCRYIIPRSLSLLYSLCPRFHYYFFFCTFLPSHRSC